MGLKNISGFDRDEFATAVREIAASVPSGRVTTYGAIAKACGYPNLSRVVGRVMGSLDPRHGIAAHRIMASGGRLTAAKAFGPSGTVEELLRSEGIDVKNGRVCGFSKIFWDPLEEI